MRPILALALLGACTSPRTAPSVPDPASAARLVESARLHAFDPRESSYFGWSIAAGDLDADGYGDLVVGVPDDASAGSGTGAIYVYYGSASGIDLSREAKVVASDACAGASFGQSVGAGDFDGDGYDDVLVGAWGDPTLGTLAGAAYVYYGSASGLDTSREQKLLASDGAVDAKFGVSVAGAHDVDGDGYDDVVVSAYGDGECGSNGGAAYVYRGSSAGIDASTERKLVPSDGTEDHYFGTSVAGARDLNGDGYAEVVVGANPKSGWYAGAAYVYYGSSGGTDPATEQRIDASDAAMKDYFGRAVGAGDLDGDGHDDLVISAYGDDDLGGESGSLYVYYGSASGLDASSEQKVNPSDGAADDRLGLGLAGTDLDGDGYSDLVAGAHWDDDMGSASGSVYVWYGGVSGLDPSTEAKLVASDGAVADYFGYSLAAAGDIDGDGLAELVVASIRSDKAATDAGVVYLFEAEAAEPPDTGEEDTGEDTGEPDTGEDDTDEAPDDTDDTDDADDTGEEPDYEEPDYEEPDDESGDPPAVRGGTCSHAGFAPAWLLLGLSLLGVRRREAGSGRKM